MADTTKPLSEYDGMQVLQKAYANGGTIATSGFINLQVGHKIELAISTTSVANDTETWTMKNGSTTLYVIQIIYTDGTRDTMVSAERIA